VGAWQHDEVNCRDFRCSPNDGSNCISIRPLKQTPVGFLLGGICVDRVREKNGSATSNQKRNNNRHGRFSCGENDKYLVRE